MPRRGRGEERDAGDDDADEEKQRRRHSRLFEESGGQADLSDVVDQSAEVG